MKKVYGLLLIIVALFIGFGCEEDNLKPNKNALRISKIADNIMMEDPWLTFEYNKDGLLEKIYSGWNSSEPTVIVYNSKKQPIKVGNDVIEWGDNEFTIKRFWENELEREKNYKLDNQGRILKITDTNFYNNNTTVTDMKWIGNDSLYIERHNESFKFNDIPHPLSSMNLAVIISADIPLGEWDIEYQNSLCLYKFSQPSISATLAYELNEQGYPIVANYRYKSGEGVDYESIYFEYEDE